MVVLIKIIVSSSDYDRKLKEIYGEFVSLKSVGIDINQFWLVTNSKELLEAARNNPPVYLKKPLYLSLFSGNSLTTPEKLN